jgi:hypothetical protein
MPIMADGSVSKAGQLFTSHGPSGPDGLALNVAVHASGMAYFTDSTNGRILRAQL